MLKRVQDKQQMQILWKGLVEQLLWKLRAILSWSKAAPLHVPRILQKILSIYLFTQLLFWIYIYIFKKYANLQLYVDLS